jgi:tRNA dimethylallyltransferase
MSPKLSKPPIVVILGPTAVGKTELAIQLAERTGGEIVSVDSRLFYVGMDIGTAKPTPEERSRVPHHLIDVCSPDDTWSLGVFQTEARKAIRGIHQRGRLPILVGGTGQYLQGLLEEWTVPELPPNEALRNILMQWSEEVTPAGLHKRLAYLDPSAAEKIDARNVRRTVRALEVIFCTGVRFSDQRQKRESDYAILKIGLKRPREELYDRIDRRVDRMIENGLIDEVIGLLNAGYSPKLPALSAIGYREIIDYLYGRLTREEAVRLIKRQTRQFVRRQSNWFKENDPDIHWLDMGDAPLIKAEKLMIEFRGNHEQR